MVSERFWPEGGGAELATYLIAEILSKNYNLTIITGTKNYKPVKDAKFFYTSKLGYRNKALLWITIIKNKNTFKKLMNKYDIIYIPRLSYPLIPLAKQLNKNVIVHLHDYAPISYTASVLAPYEQHKSRIREDDLMLECLKSFGHCISASFLWWLPRLARKWIQHADKIVCVSKRHAEIINDAIPEFRSKIRIIYNPPPPIQLTAKKPNHKPTFLFSGGDSYIKGFHIVFKAFRTIIKKGYRPILILANDYNIKTRKLINKLNNKYGKIFHLVGRVRHESMFNIHKKAWALISPSISEETMGYVVVESMYWGTIPIASSVGGIPEIVDRTIARKYLFNIENFMELIDRVETVLSLSKEELINISAKLREDALKKFRSDFVEKQLLRVFT